MAKIMELLEELDVLEAVCRKAEDAYFDDEENEEKEAEFGEAVNAESAAFHRMCDAIVEYTDGRIQTHVAMRILMNKRDALREIISGM